MSTTFISIICPTYNSAEFIEKTLQSVVDQRDADYELIISDDGSSDDTLDVVRKFMSGFPAVNYQLSENPHKGPGAARNTAIRAAKGNWIAFLDSDDVWHLDKLKKMYQVIDENSQINFICHNAYFYKLNGSKVLFDYTSWVRSDELLVKQLYYRNRFSTPVVTLKKDLFLKVGFFDEDSISEDYDLWLKLSPFIKAHLVKDVLTYIYEREGSLTKSHAYIRWKSVMKVLRRYRRKVSFSFAFFCQSRVTLYYIKQYVLSKIKRS